MTLREYVDSLRNKTVAVLGVGLMVGMWVAPRTGAWIEITIRKFYDLVAGSRAPYGRVD